MFRVVLHILLAAILLAATAVGAFFLGDGLVRLVVRGGGESITPAVVGLTLEEATAASREAEMTLVMDRSEHSLHVPPGRILWQKPEAGANVRQGRILHVVVSLGSEALLVPDMGGMSERSARSVAEQRGLGVGVVLKACSETVPEDHVISTSPPPRTETARGQRIDLLVSLGPRLKYLSMPDLVGVSLSDAKRELQRAELALGEVRYTRVTDVPPDTVIRQSPDYGKRVHQGDEVTLEVSFNW